jgi:general secretion pathway protein G
MQHSSISSVKNINGFTIIEIMVVIVILGLLISIVGPRLIGRTDDARVSTARMQIEGLSSALKMYKLDMGSYPTTEQGLEALVTPPATDNNTSKWRKGGYLEKGKVPKDPWGNPYTYLQPGAHGDFDIISNGADGVPGGEDYNKDITNWDAE